MGRYELLAAALAVVCLTLTACSTGKNSLVRHGHTEGTLAAGTANLPAFPAEHAASGLTEYFIDGSEAIETGLGATVQGTLLDLDSSSGGYAWAIYGFDTQQELLDSVHVLFDAADGSEVWIGLANYDENRWDFSEPLTQSRTMLLDSAVHVSPLGALYLCAVTSEGDAATVEKLSLRTFNADNKAPLADISSDMQIGFVGDTFSFDTSGSSDSDGQLVLYELDFNADGFFDAQGHSGTAVKYTYSEPGVFDVALRVTDNNGDSDTATVSVRVNEVLGHAHPWGVLGQNLRNTRRSTYVGPQTNSVKWLFESGEVVYSTPIIAADGSIYISNIDEEFIAVNPDGTEKWCTAVGDISFNHMALGDDGAIYVVTYDGELVALNPDGTERWRYASGQTSESSVVVGPGGVLYFGTIGGRLYAVNPDGTLRWQADVPEQEFSSLSAPVSIARDGNIYAAAGGTLAAFTPNGTLKWDFETGDSTFGACPIGPDGTIYLPAGNDGLFAVSPKGEQIWQYTASGKIDTDAALAPDGTIYAGGSENTLRAINPDGTEKWQYPLGLGGGLGSPVIDADGTIYVEGGGRTFLALNPDGTLKWSADLEGSAVSPPTIGPDGTVYLGIFDEVYGLIAFGNPGANLAPLAKNRGFPDRVDPDENVTFDASDSFDVDGTVVDYVWDTDDDGTYNESDNGEDLLRGMSEIDLTFSEPGYQSVSVRVTDDDGASSARSSTVIVRGWAVIIVDNENDTGMLPSLASIGGNPAISYYHQGDGDLRYAYSRNRTGALSDDWEIYIVDSSGNTGSDSSLALVNGHPAISYHDIDNANLRYVRSTSATGRDTQHWINKVTVDAGTHVGQFTSLEVVNGNPAISYYDNNTDDLKYARSSTNTGSIAADWSAVITVESSGSVGSYSSLAVVSGSPAIAHYDAGNGNLLYARSTASDGSLPGDWSQKLTVDDSSSVGQYPSLLQVAGNPAICYWDSSANNLLFARSSSASGAIQSDWSNKFIVSNNGGQYASMVIFEGNPVIAFYNADDGNLYTAFSSTASGSNQADWNDIQTVDSSADVGSFCSLAVIGERLAVAYLDNDNLDLKYAVLFDDE